MNETNDIYSLEAQVVGSIASVDEAILVAAQHLNIDELSDKRSRDVFAAALELSSANQKINIVSIGQAIKAAGRLDPEEMSWIADCARVGTKNMEILAQSTKEIHLSVVKQQIALDLRKMSEEISDRTSETDILERIGKITDKLGGFDSQNPAPSAYMAEYLESWNEKTIDITTGIDIVDKMIHVEPGDFVFIGGRPGVGKTAFAEHMAIKNSVFSKNHKSLFVSCEMSRNQIVSRAISLLGDINGAKLNAKSEDIDINKFSKAQNMLELGNMDIIDHAGSGCGEYNRLIQLIKMLQNVNNYSLIFIDYLQTISYSGRQFKQNSDKLAEITQGIRQLATQMKVPIFAISQLTRDSETKNPNLEAFAGSDEISRAATHAIILSKYFDANDRLDSTKLNLSIVKNRHGILTELPIIIGSQPSRCRFYSLDGTGAVEQFGRPTSMKKVAM